MVKTQATIVEKVYILRNTGVSYEVIAIYDSANKALASALEKKMAAQHIDIREYQLNVEGHRELKITGNVFDIFRETKKPAKQASDPDTKEEEVVKNNFSRSEVIAWFSTLLENKNGDIENTPFLIHATVGNERYVAKAKSVKIVE